MEEFLKTVSSYIGANDQANVNIYMRVEVADAIASFSKTFVSNNREQIQEFLGSSFTNVMSSSSLPIRVILMQLLNAIVNNIRGNMQDTDEAETKSILVAIGRRVYPIAVAAASRDVDATSIIPHLSTIISEWMDKKIFRTHMMRNALKYLTDYAPTPQTQTLFDSNSPNSQKQAALKRKESVKLIERIRARQKKQHMENVLRSLDESKLGWMESQKLQFNEMWTEMIQEPHDDFGKYNTFDNWWSDQNKRACLQRSPKLPQSTNILPPNSSSNNKKDERKHEEEFSTSEKPKVTTPKDDANTQQTRVIIWDLDKILTPLHILSDEKLCKELDVDIETGSENVKKFESIVSYLVEKNMFFDQLQIIPSSHNTKELHALIKKYESDFSDEKYNFDDGFNCKEVTNNENNTRKLAQRYQHILQIYKNCDKNSLQELLGKRWEELLNRLKKINEYTKCHLATSVDVLHHMSTQINPAIHMLISQESLIPVFAKCMLLGFTNYIPVENVYSCGDISREVVFDDMTKQAREKYPNCKIMMIGEECAANLEVSHNLPVNDADMCGSKDIEYHGLSTDANHLVELARRL